MTERPRRSIRRVLGPAIWVISRSAPTATRRPSRIATACAIVNRSSTVMIFPFDRTTSGAGCCARNPTHASTASVTEPLFSHQVRDVFLIFIADEFHQFRPELQMHRLRRGGPGLGVSPGIVDRRRDFHD